MRGPRIVAIGGGTGLSRLVGGLVAHGSRPDVTAIVAVSDDGGSSGRLRALGLPAVGDARACLSAAVRRQGWARVLEHRFSTGELAGHAVGNLILAAAHETEGSFSSALGLVSQLVGPRARVLPATDVPVRLAATLDDGSELEGETVLARRAGFVVRLSLRPELVPPAPGVLEAISRAEVLVLGPGSLFTSVLAAALPAGIARAIEGAAARRILVQNLTTERGQTDGFDVAGHVRAVRAHLGERSVDVVLAHVWEGAVPEQGLVADAEALAAIGVRLVTAVLATDRLHDPRRLAEAIVQLARGDEGAVPVRGAG